MHFTIEQTYNARPEQIWKALTDKEEMKKWYFDVSDFRTEPGFEFNFYGENQKGEKFLHLCKITDAEPMKKLRHSWVYDQFGGDSYVTWELFPEGDKTRVRLTHEGLDSFPADKPDFARANFEAGWTEITGTSLKNHLEGTSK